jgi:translation initiation factor 1
MQNEINFNPILDIKTSITATADKIHVRLQQRNGKKSNTFIENLPKNLDLLQITKKMKHTFHCNGCVHDNESGSSIQLFGDQRQAVKQFLIDNSVAEDSNIMIHGY